MPYFDSPYGLVKIQTSSKNSQRHYTTARLIRDLLSNTLNCYLRPGKFRGYLFTVRYAKWNGIGAGNADWSTAGEQSEPAYRMIFVLYEVQLDNKTNYLLVNIINNLQKVIRHCLQEKQNCST